MYVSNSNSISLKEKEINQRELYKIYCNFVKHEDKRMEFGVTQNHSECSINQAF